MSAPTVTSSGSDDSRLLAELSHEIRTPLTALLGYVELLLDPPAADPLPQRAQDKLRIVQDNGLHILNLIENVLDWACVDAQSTPRRQVVSPKQLAEETVRWLSPRVDSSDIAVRCIVHNSTPAAVITDQSRLRQILLNLLGNALKFTRHGEVRLELRGLRSADSAALQIDVSDTGIGMTPQQLERLFIPFAPGDTARFDGCGLGLAISQRLCQSLGGRLSVSSLEAEGSTFRIELPVDVVDDNAWSSLGAGSEPRLSRTDRPLRGCRILLADDSPDTRRLISLLLRQAGAEVAEVTNGREATAMALTSWQHSWIDASQSKRPFDLILLDLHMPLCDGLTATRELREAGYPAPIIALTGADRPHDKAACLEAGCNGYAAKPLDRRRLIETICQWCSASLPTS